jgi:hypothetical protein
MTIPNPFAASYERGVTHLKRAEYEAAVAAFSEAIQLAPGEPKAYAGRALAYRSLDKEADAVSDEEKVRELGGVRPAREEFVLLLTPDFHISQRVDQQAFLNFFGAVDATIKNYFQEFPQPEGLDVQVACAVLPQDKLLVEVQVQPKDVPDEVLLGLRQRIEALPRPEVRHGPVAFSSRSLVGGGCPDSDVEFGFPFASLMKTGTDCPLDDALMVAGGFNAASASWWGRLKQAMERAERKVLLLFGGRKETSLCPKNRVRLKTRRIVVGGNFGRGKV